MPGYWELWDLDSRNALADFDTEAEAVELVRELIGSGWKPADLMVLNLG